MDIFVNLISYDNDYDVIPIEIDDTIEGYKILLSTVQDYENELRWMAMMNAIQLATMAMHPHYNMMLLCYLTMLFSPYYELEL